MDGGLVGFAALIAGFIGGVLLITKESARTVREITFKQTIDRAELLSAFRREIANILIWRNPQRYLDIYRQIHSEVYSLKMWKLEEVSNRLAALSIKYPHYTDFDAVGTREYVLYADGLCMLDYGEIEQRYIDLVMFVACSSLVDPAWKDAADRRLVHTTSDNELAHLTEYVKRIEDTRLLLRIERAIEDNYLALSISGKNLDNNVYSIINLPDYAASKYAIHLKRTEEFCIYVVFTYGDGRRTERYFRSDATFTQENHLNVIRPVLDERKLER